MTENLRISKDEDHQMPIPESWRNVFKGIVEALKDEDFTLMQGINGVRPISVEDSERLARSIANYGCKLISLPEESWNTSVCQWMDGYWDVLIDLYTKEEGASDLVLAARVYEERDSSFAYDIQSIYVP